MEAKSEIVYDLTHSLAHNNKWVKANIVSTDFDGGIFYEKAPIPYIHRIHETLIDSSGGSHCVQVGYEDKECQLKDEYFKIIHADGRDWVDAFNCPIDPDMMSFQFNLKLYMIIGWFKGYSPLSHFRWITDKKKNMSPDYLDITHWESKKAMTAIGYAPFYEHCYGNAQTNYIPDRLFFNYPNREVAIKRIICGVVSERYEYNLVNPFKDFDYVNATDIELVKFMNDRFQKRLRYEEFLKTHNYLLT